MFETGRGWVNLIWLDLVTGLLPVWEEILIMIALVWPVKIGVTACKLRAARHEANGCVRLG